jgi:hypothetical protein
MLEATLSEGDDAPLAQPRKAEHIAGTGKPLKYSGSLQDQHSLTDSKLCYLWLVVCSIHIE